MAKSKYLDLNGALYFWNKVKSYVDDLGSTKVDKVAGKGLSTNDLTDELKEKLLNAGDSSFDGVYTSLLNKPKINSIELEGELTLDKLGIQPAGNYALKSELPTVPTKLSAFTNDSDYYTGTQVASAISGKADTSTVNSALALKADKTEVTSLQSSVNTALAGKADASHSHVIKDITDFPSKVSHFSNDSNYQTATQVATSIADAVGQITQFDTQIVSDLPQTGKKGVIYFKAASKSGTNQIYDEYIWVNDSFEFIGTTAVDLTNYLQKTDIEAVTNAEIDEIMK